MFSKPSMSLLLLLTIVLPAAAKAQSLWDKRVPSKAFLFHDTQASRVGDSLTVVVGETTDVNNQESRSLKKETDTNSKLDLLHSAAGIFGGSAGTLSESGSVTSNRGFDGNASFSSERAFSGRITAVVTDVLPNGNLVVSGKRQINVAGDLRCLVMSGIVRWQDISADNSIESRYVSNLEMHYEEKGVEPRFTSQGWLGKATNWLWPF